MSGMCPSTIITGIGNIVVYGVVEQGQRFGSAGGQIDDHVPGAQHALEDTAVGGIVVDHQNPHAAQDFRTDKTSFPIAWVTASN